MKFNRFMQLQTVRLAQSAPIEQATWASYEKGTSALSSSERCWVELRGDTILMYPSSEVVGQFHMHLTRRGIDTRAGESKQLLEMKREDMKPDLYSSLIYSLSGRVPHAKIVPILFRICRKMANLEARSISFTEYNCASSPFSQKSITLTFDTDEDMQIWENAMFTIPEVYQKTLSDFSLVEHVGHGATSEVFLVRDRFSHKKLAMKAIAKEEACLRFGSLRRIIDERIVHSRMKKHPFILEMSHAFETPGSLYVATEYCSRGDLFHYLRRTGVRVEEAKAKIIVAETLLALEALHDQGIWYRDLKPENIMVADDGHVKLGDFGAAKITDPMKPVQRSMSSVGTVEYLAPEMAGEKPYNRMVDVWAFGILICELINGETPYSGVTESLTYENIRGSPLILPITMSTEARDLVRRLLHRNQAKRLGAGVNGWGDVKAHPWFRDIDWEMLLLQPPRLGPFEAVETRDRAKAPERKARPAPEGKENPHERSKREAAEKFEYDLRRDFQFTTAVRLSEKADRSSYRGRPRHPLWHKRDIQRTLGSYACGDKRKSSTPMAMEPHEPLGIRKDNDGSISYVTFMPDHGEQPLSGSYSSLYRNRSRPGFWKKLSGRLRFWRKQ